MGDLVAVMQLGGHLAQFAPPDEILANPASDFVARFVGADRGLKRLSLTPGRRPGAPPAGDRAGRASDAGRRPAAASTGPAFPYLLRRRRAGAADRLARRRPTSRPRARSARTLADAMPARSSTAETTLKDALSMLLDADVQAGIVVDRAGEPLGLAHRSRAIGEALRPRAARLPAAAAPQQPRAR